MRITKYGDGDSHYIQKSKDMVDIIFFTEIAVDRGLKLIPSGQRYNPEAHCEMTSKAGL